MDAQISLKLRSSDRSTLLVRRHEDQKSIKRDHIKEILITNFQRKYQRPLPDTADAMPNYEIDRLLNDEANKFLQKNPHAINSKELAEFEKHLAAKMGWAKNKPREKQPTIAVPKATTALTKSKSKTRIDF